MPASGVCIVFMREWLAWLTSSGDMCMCAYVCTCVCVLVCVYLGVSFVFVCLVFNCAGCWGEPEAVTSSHSLLSWTTEQQLPWNYCTPALFPLFFVLPITLKAF